MEISPLVAKIVRKQATKYYYGNWVIVHKFCDIEDFEQIIWERLWVDGLWECKDHGLVCIVANRACIDWCRSTISGYRKRKVILADSIEDLIEIENESSYIYDNKYYEIVSLNSLIEALYPVKNRIVKSLIKGHTLKEIGEQINLTESRICQIRSAIIGRLINLYKRDKKFDRLPYSKTKSTKTISTGWWKMKIKDIYEAELKEKEKEISILQWKLGKVNKEADALRILLDSKKSDEKESENISLPQNSKLIESKNISMSQNMELFGMKGTGAYEYLVKTYFKDKSFKPKEIKSIATEKGLTIKGKEISNGTHAMIINYLTKKGIIERIDSGIYKYKTKEN